MSIKVYEPLSGQLTSERTGLVVLNQVGATLSQDTGRDAQALADAFDLVVIGADRPGTAGLMPSAMVAARLSTPATYVAEISRLGKKVDRQADALGLDRLVVTGRSAGGLGALALARSETVGGLTHLFAAEPVGCEAMEVAVGEQLFKDYGERQKVLQQGSNVIMPKPPDLPRLEAASRLISIAPTFLYDKFHNQRIWASDAALQYAGYIAEHLDQIDTTIEFAEHSMVATPMVYDTELLRIAALRTSDVPFTVRQTESTTHASYDNRKFMAAQLRPIVARAVRAL